jgi:hypothetical protein
MTYIIKIEQKKIVFLTFYNKIILFFDKIYLNRFKMYIKLIGELCYPIYIIYKVTY